VNEYLADAKARDLAESTLSKLETIFRKQFLGWAESDYLEETDIESLRKTVADFNRELIRLLIKHRTFKA